MTSLGTLPNAPLACVLIAIQFEEIPDFESKFAAVKDALKAYLPRLRESEKQVQGLPNRQAVIDVHEFISENLRQSLRITKYQLSLIVTEYSRSESLINLFSDLLNIVWEKFDPLVTRIGIRYIDFILPRLNEQPEDYVIESIRGIPDLKLGQVFSVSANFTHYQFDDGMMLIRYASGMGRPVVPPEIGLESLQPSDVMARSHDGRSAILDFDRSGDFSARIGKAEVLTKVTQYQMQLSKAFKEITTQAAVDVWSKGDKQ